MVSHVESTFPKEGCGLMIGSDGFVQEAVPLPNSYTGPQEDFFVIDPKDLHRVDRESRNTVVAIQAIARGSPRAIAQDLLANSR